MQTTYTTLATLRKLKTQTKNTGVDTHNKYIRTLERLPAHERYEYLLELKRYWPKLVTNYKETIRTGPLVSLMAMID